MEFMPNQSEANAAAKKLRFRFENANELPLALYLRQKQLALRDAGYRDEAAIKLALWETLDIELKGITALRAYESLPEFMARVRENESAAFASWQSKGRMTRQSQVAGRVGYREMYREPRPQTGNYPIEECRHALREDTRSRERYPAAPTRNEVYRSDRKKEPDKDGQKGAKPMLARNREPRRPCRHCNGSH